MYAHAEPVDPVIGRLPREEKRGLAGPFLEAAQKPRSCGR